MIDQRKIGIAIPTYNRADLLFDSFSKVMDSDIVDEITIVDDASELDIFVRIQETAEPFPKIKLFRNARNCDCFFNKKKAVELSTNEWLILFDSDNVLDFDYLNTILKLEKWEENTAYLPSKALPHFDYSKYDGLEVTRENVHKYMDDPTFTCALNTMNYFINRNFYLKCWSGEQDPHTSDSIYMNYLWLKNGGKLYIVPGLTYQHRVDNHGNEQPGHYQTENHKTGKFHQQVEQMLKELR